MKMDFKKHIFNRGKSWSFILPATIHQKRFLVVILNFIIITSLSFSLITKAFSYEKSSCQVQQPLPVQADSLENILVEIEKESLLNDQNKKNEHSKNYLVIDRKAFINNIKATKSFLKEGVKLCAVLKSNAYGHGVDYLAEAAQKSGVNYLGFADNVEAKTIREKGVDLPLIRLRPVSTDQVMEAMQWNVEEIVGNYQKAQEISIMAQKLGKKVKVHLNLNSGKIGRDAFEMDDYRQRSDALKTIKLPGLEIRGIMSHFASEDSIVMKEQLSSFLKETTELIEKGRLNRDNILLHIGASSAITILPEAQLDMVRVGALLYAEPNINGYLPKDIKPVMLFISSIKNSTKVQKGQRIPGFKKFRPAEDTNVVIVPVGLNNGIPHFPDPLDFNQTSIRKTTKIFLDRMFNKKLRNNVKTNWVFIKGKTYPIINISQNLTSIDISNDKGQLIGEGDEVAVLVNKNNGKRETFLSYENALKSSVSGVYLLKKGQTLGYDGIKVERDTRIATIPIGYAENGFPDKKKDKLFHNLSLSTIAGVVFKKIFNSKIRPTKRKTQWVYIKGQRFPILEINQEAALIDVKNSSIKMVRGDRVFFLGGKEKDGISIIDMAPNGEYPDKIMIQLGHNKKNRIIVKD